MGRSRKTVPAAAVAAALTAAAARQLLAQDFVPSTQSKDQQQGLALRGRGALAMCRRHLSGGRCMLAALAGGTGAAAMLLSSRGARPGQSAVERSAAGVAFAPTQQDELRAFLLGTPLVSRQAPAAETPPQVVAPPPAPPSLPVAAAATETADVETAQPVTVAEPVPVQAVPETAPVKAAAEAELRPEAVPEEEEPFNPAKQLGVTQPLGFFDPLGFSKVGDESGFRGLRSAEMKHGRVAMMAAVGALAQAFFQFPGFEDVPKGLGAVTTSQGVFGFASLFLLSGALELTVWKDDQTKGVASIGDFGNPLQLGVGAPLGESEDMRNRELNNGRAAMFAAVGIIVAELVSGKNALEQLG